ncbi:MAG: metallophosphoesterase [Myxococcales bacterium]|nr:metallophosphoesterase [Myxococcales bacterium]
MIRVAAVGDLHVGCEGPDPLCGAFANVHEHADVLLLAGDLTQHGDPKEARNLLHTIEKVRTPVVAVFGNHDYHMGHEEELARDLRGAGVHVLEAESVVLDVAGTKLGIAGCKGFGAGFPGACGTEFGEPEMKAFIHHSKAAAHALGEALAAMVCDVRVALTHYAPVKDTLVGERLEIFPFLGSYFLGEVIDHAACDLALHGHAHRGTEHGMTPSGVPVRNVARPVIRCAYKVYRVAASTLRSSTPARC